MRHFHFLTAFARGSRHESRERHHGHRGHHDHHDYHGHHGHHGHPEFHDHHGHYGHHEAHGHHDPYERHGHAGRGADGHHEGGRGRHGRHAGGGRGWFGGPWGGHGRGGDADDSFGGDGRHWARGRKVSADDLQLMLLGLLEQNPSHGYELIKALGAMSNGFYTPSPGMVYPALTYLEELGYATVEQEGSKKRYHLADPGREYLEANRERLSVMFNKLKHVARKMDWMRQAWSGEPRPAADEEDASGWIDEFVHARQEIRHALLQRTEASPAEQRRIAAILRRATAEITGKSCD
ncbi:PadR family transcriptional regulator [Achromobacter insuavis]|uniref:PadR family transcriptional regulator n=1 Tax=Achromobacter insuavis TaxID=1287735 RepID=UPI001F130A32|nr:PadR family transcriptional regulator [Achromobacter insuavis]